MANNIKHYVFVKKAHSYGTCDIDLNKLAS